MNLADDGEEVHGYRWPKIIAAVEVAALSSAVTSDPIASCGCYRQ